MILFTSKKDCEAITLFISDATIYLPRKIFEMYFSPEFIVDDQTEYTLDVHVPSTGLLAVNKYVYNDFSVFLNDVFGIFVYMDSNYDIGTICNMITPRENLRANIMLSKLFAVYLLKCPTKRLCEILGAIHEQILDEIQCDLSQIHAAHDIYYHGFGHITHLDTIFRIGFSWLINQLYGHIDENDYILNSMIYSQGSAIKHYNSIERGLLTDIRRLVYEKKIFHVDNIFGSIDVLLYIDTTQLRPSLLASFIHGYNETFHEEDFTIENFYYFMLYHDADSKELSLIYSAYYFWNRLDKIPPSIFIKRYEKISSETITRDISAKRLTQKILKMEKNNGD